MKNNRYAEFSYQLKRQLRILWLYSISISVFFVHSTFAGAGASYSDQIAAYKAEAKPIESAPRNSSFVSDLAMSQVKVAISKNSQNGLDSTGFSSLLKESSVGQVGINNTTGGLSIASPIITGTVNGNVTVVVQKGAIKGNITAISPK